MYGVDSIHAVFFARFFSYLAIYAKVPGLQEPVLIHALVAPEKQGNSARTGMASDGGSDVVDLNFSI